MVECGKGMAGGFIVLWCRCESKLFDTYARRSIASEQWRVCAAEAVPASVLDMLKRWASNGGSEPGPLMRVRSGAGVGCGALWFAVLCLLFLAR